MLLIGTLGGLTDFALHYWIEVVFGIIVTGGTYLYRQLLCKLRTQRADQEALCDGTLALLRSEIIRNYDHYITKGFTPLYAMENVLALYEAYHCLGGNGAITKLVEELKDQPTIRNKQ